MEYLSHMTTLDSEGDAEAIILQSHGAAAAIFDLWHGEAGRNGQIRTADLPLRRRPLYPSELRSHGDFLYSRR